MILSLIAAMSENRVIGVGNKLPWSIPEDLKYFRDTTLGKPIIMGRKTFESIGKPLPKRRNIILTRQKDFKADGIEVVSTLEDALQLLIDQPEVFVIGGADVYRQALPIANRLYLTLVHRKMDGDAFFPEFSSKEFALRSTKDLRTTDLRISFQRFDRAEPGEIVRGQVLSSMR